MASEFDSERFDAGEESRLDASNEPLSRREIRLRAEQEKMQLIARELERERIREAALKRAEEIRREKEAAAHRESETERFQEQINTSQQLPVLPKDAVLAAPTREAATTTPGYAERGHEGAKRRQRAEAKSEKRESARAARTVRTSAPRTHKLRNGLGRTAVVLVVSGLMAVLALPATGFNTSGTGWALNSNEDDQSVRVASEGTEAAKVALSEYSVTTYADLLKITYGQSSGFSYSVTNSGRIRWPFGVVVPISSGFGERVAPCLGCSSYHEGLDFNPTEGTPFYAVADGEVVEVNNDTWGFGKWVVIRHTVGKLQFDSLYAHMLRDSTGVKVGQKVKAGDYIGRVGNSGNSTGAHLHLEIFVDGVPVDPFDWLKKHTKQN